MSDPTPTEKRCTKCGEIKPIDAFHRCKARKDGYQNYCKECQATYRAAYAETNIKQPIRDDIPTEKRCSQCGETKLIDAFSKTKTNKSGRSSNCRACKAQYQASVKAAQRIYHHTYYWANVEKKREQSRALYAKNIEANRERRRKWYAANLESIRQYGRDYYAANAEKIRTRYQAYEAANPEKRRAQKQAYVDANRDRIRVRRRELYEANFARLQQYYKAYRAANLEKIKAYLNAYRAANPDVFRAAVERRRARKKGVGGDFSPQELKTMRKVQNGICAYCQFHYDDPLQIDHVIPIAQGGPHQASNIVLACPVCNMNKGNRTPEQWTDRWYMRKPKEDQGTEE